MSNPNKGKWYRFNDTTVEEFEMTEESLETECFGGKYKAKVFDNGECYCGRFHEICFFAKLRPRHRKLTNIACAFKKWIQQMCSARPRMLSSKACFKMKPVS